MLLQSPEWIQHSDQKNKSSPIYSLHHHPSELQLATGGQDFKVKIWNLDHIASLKGPTLLSTLISHTGAVLCVRWSTDGTYIASGSDDTKIVIWTRDSTSLNTFGEEKNLIGFRVVKVLNGHESDVSDLAWSPNGHHLASCGFDCKIYIWDTDSFGSLNLIQKKSPLSMRILISSRGFAGIRLGHTSLRKQTIKPLRSFA